MKKSYKSICSMLIVFVLLLSNSFFFSSSAATDFDPYLSMWGLDGKAVVEYIDGVRYVYMVKNKEVTILNILTGFSLTGEKTLTLPETLSGYPVKKLGYFSPDRGSGIEVFVYIFNNGDNHKDVFPDYDYAPEYDSVVYRKNPSDAITLIIPEGYECIEKNALNGFSGFIKFPKSLKTFNHTWYLSEWFWGQETFIGESTFVFPECKYNYDFQFEFVNDSYIFPSRDPSVADELCCSLETSPSAICFPSNTSAQLIESALYNDDGTPVGWYHGATVYCPADSEFIPVIEEMGGYTVNTNVPYAEYIEFPEENVNIRVGDVVDLEAKSYPENATWTACDYTVSDPSIVKIDEYSGRITALKEGTVTVTATHCERGYVDTCIVNVTTKPEPGVNGIEPATDTPYVTYGNRDYKINVTGSPSKIQVVRDNGGTTTIDRRKAQVTSNGDTETWIVNMRVEAGTHNIRAKYGKVWEERLTPFTVKYDLPGAYSFDLTYQNGIGNFDVVTDPEVIKIQFALDNGCTLTYSQVY
ncbi:MAG: Ig domain-containing protein, partial [Clostridia bacterium]|nr:Ig domain-containing protein [Clostridia bacterium]